MTQQQNKTPNINWVDLTEHITNAICSVALIICVTVFAMFWFSPNRQCPQQTSVQQQVK